MSGSAPNLTDLSVIRSLCERYGFTLSKGFGQNFIINPGICPRIVAASGIGPGMGVLEIGPGIGVLTRELAATADRVVAVEIDRRLPPLLAETLADCDNVQIVQGDILKLPLGPLLREKFGTMPVAVAANLPYYITSPVLMRLLEQRLPLQSITVMVQKEAAQRICAAPGSRPAGAISYAVAYYAAAEVLFDVKPGSFYPAPKVTSSVIRLTPRTAPPVDVGNEAFFFHLIRAAFGQRRKTAVNSISAGLGLPKQAIADALARAGLPDSVRPEQLTLDDFARLSRALTVAGPEA